jgi:pyruvate,water dikinase
MIMNAGLPDDVIQAIEESYGEMCQCNLHTCGKDCSVAVRSSATAEDLPTASFAGQQASFLNVVGKHSVASAVLECLASIFTDRAIAYRVHNGFGHMDVKGAGKLQIYATYRSMSSLYSLILLSFQLVKYLFN